MSERQSPEQVLDPMIDEVRNVRRELSERFGNDVAKLCDFLEKIEAEHVAQLVAADREQVATKSTLNAR